MKTTILFVEQPQGDVIIVRANVVVEFHRFGRAPIIAAGMAARVKRSPNSPPGDTLRPERIG